MSGKPLGQLVGGGQIQQSSSLQPQVAKWIYTWDSQATSQSYLGTLQI
jgi:hypothetical protein